MCVDVIPHMHSYIQYFVTQENLKTVPKKIKSEKKIKVTYIV